MLFITFPLILIPSFILLSICPLYLICRRYLVMAREGFHLSSSSHYNFLCRVLLIYHKSKGLTHVQKVQLFKPTSSLFKIYQSYFSSIPDQMLFHNQQSRHIDSLYTGTQCLFHELFSVCTAIRKNLIYQHYFDNYVNSCGLFVLSKFKWCRS